MSVLPAICTSPVVLPPIVRVLKSVVWIERGAPASVRLPENEAFPVVVRVVKLPVDGVVTPIAVLLMPVAVVVKLDDVNVRAFAPASNVDAPSPVRTIAPDVPVIFTAPAVTVRPFEAVKSPLDVIVPPDVVRRFPIVERFPFSEIVNVAEPLD